MVFPGTLFEKKRVSDGYRLISTGVIVVSETIHLYPVDADRPVLSLFRFSESAVEPAFKLCGTVRIPLYGRTIPVELNGVIRVEPQPDDSFAVVEIAADALLPLTEPAHDIILRNGRVLLAGCRFHTEIRLQGTVRFTSEGIEAEGKLDTPIQYLPDGDGACAISTLLSHASIGISPAIGLEDGTIRFEYCSLPERSNHIRRQFDENDELLFQMSEPIGLGNAAIEGESDKPITLWAQLVPSATKTSHLLLHLFPSRLKTAFIGDRTILFLHGDRYDEPFTVNTSGPWNATISSNVYLHLVAPDDLSGKPLLTSIVFVEGELEGVGLQSPTIRLFTGGTMQGTLFPETPVACTIPDQPFQLYHSSNGDPDCRFTVPVPLTLADGTRITSVDKCSTTLYCSLSREGFLFRDVCGQPPGNDTAMIIHTCTVNGEGRIVHLESDVSG